MKLIAEIIAKVETNSINDGSPTYMFHVGLAKDGADLSGEGGIKAALKVTAEEFNSYTVGEEIIFEEVES